MSVTAKNKWLSTVEKTVVRDYELVHYCGAGRVGYVYRARLRNFPTVEYAVKLIPDPEPDWDKEITKVAVLSQVPNVVHFHTLGSELITHGENRAQVLYTVWEYIDGENLKDYLKTHPKNPISFYSALITTILRVLHNCHELKVPRHGDLHAGNILIGRAKGLVDDKLRPVAPIYVADFGYGTTGGRPQPSDDYVGLRTIANLIIKHLDRSSANMTDRQMLSGINEVLNKVLQEKSFADRVPALEILRALQDIEQNAGLRIASTGETGGVGGSGEGTTDGSGRMTVGQFQVAEMLGDHWDLWKSLFVQSVPARSRILERDITTLVTGPRGCGKTMLFRRLSERLMIECGPLKGAKWSTEFVGLYVNANDFADAFSRFSDKPSSEEAARLYAYLHLSILADALAVESIHCRKHKRQSQPALLAALEHWLGGTAPSKPLVSFESPLERYRAVLELHKQKFTRSSSVDFPGVLEFAQHTFLMQLIGALRGACPWFGQRSVFVFIDDYTTPRVSASMQRVLNRALFQRTSEFVIKIATEAATTFVAEDSTGKVLQDGDDYKLIDMGEESLFMSEEERLSFLNEVFKRRLEKDARIPSGMRSLPALLGNLGLSKTAFARILRAERVNRLDSEHEFRLRGAAKRKALYHGADVFACLWSGDTRLMIQLVQDLVDDWPLSQQLPIAAELQDRAFRNRGGNWLDVQGRNQPTDSRRFEELAATDREFSLTGGSFGSHLKAIVEAFAAAARLELIGPVYEEKKNGKIRTVPRMAFRIEINDEFRVEGLAAEIYKDLIRYGIFMRDARGKSVRGAMVPRLYLRRLLLPYCVLPLSKRDSVPLTCEWFRKLLMFPDKFASEWPEQRKAAQAGDTRQLGIFPAATDIGSGEIDPRYDDLSKHEGSDDDKSN